MFLPSMLCSPQVDKVTGRFNGQFKTYAICGAIRRMVSVASFSFPTFFFVGVSKGLRWTREETNPGFLTN